ncbi:hypothetical protein Tco_0554923, partial [Tanacetum coccineum]
DVDLEKKEAEVEDDDDGDTYDIWDITVEDIERIRQFLMPNVVSHPQTGPGRNTCPGA